MSQHIIRDLPGMHAVNRRVFCTKKVNASHQGVRFVSMPLLREKQPHEQRAKPLFEPVEGKSWRWGVFDCQVYVALSYIRENGHGIRAGQQFIIASGGKLEGGAIQPFGFWKRLIQSNDLTHYEIVVDDNIPNKPSHPSFSRFYLARKKLDSSCLLE